VDPPHDGNNLSFYAGDERTDGSDDNTVVNIHLHESGLPASQQLPQMQYLQLFIPILKQCLLELQENATDYFKDMAGNYKNIVQYHMKVAKQLLTIGKTIGHNTENMAVMLNNASNHNNHHFDVLNGKMNSLLQKLEAAWTENTTLHEAYCTSREETALFKATMDTLMKNIDENITISTAPFTGNCNYLQHDGGDDDATILGPK
jgi:hypothetical protein